MPNNTKSDKSYPPTVVYSAQGCRGCLFTKRHLDRLNVPYVEVDITNTASEREKLIARGFLGLPVVEAEGHAAWTGYSPSRIADVFEN